MRALSVAAMTVFLYLVAILAMTVIVPYGKAYAGAVIAAVCLAYVLGFASGAFAGSRQ